MQPEADAPRIEQFRTPEGQISRAIAEIHKELVGHGPVRALTRIDDESVICILEGCLTRAEKRMAVDHPSVVREIRRKYQDAMREPIVAAVERFTGREAQAFMGDHDPGPDVAIMAIKLAASPRLRVARTAVTDHRPPAE